MFKIFNDNYHRGFSLLEFLVFSLLFIPIVFFSSRSYANFQEISDLKQASIKISSILKSALIRSTRENQTIKIKFDRFSYLIFREDESNSLILEGKISRIQSLKSAPPEIKCFKSFSCTPATLTFEKGKSKCQLSLSLRGRITTGC